MADTTYIPKIQHSNNGDKLTVASGGQLSIESGGAADIESGGEFDVQSGGAIDFEAANTMKWKGAAANPVFWDCHNVTTAEVNAGHALLAATTGRTYRVLDWAVTARGGAAATATAVLLQDTAGTPVVIATIAVAALTQDETVNPGSAGVAGGAGGGGVALTADKGVSIIKSGSDVATATSFDVVLLYTY